MTSLKKDKPDKPKKKPKIRENRKNEIEVEVEADTRVSGNEFARDLYDLDKNRKKKVVICGKNMVNNQHMAVRLALQAKLGGHKIKFLIPKGLDYHALTISHLGLADEFEESDEL